MLCRAYSMGNVRPLLKVLGGISSCMSSRPCTLLEHQALRVGEVCPPNLLNS